MSLDCCYCFDNLLDNDNNSDDDVIIYDDSAFGCTLMGTAVDAVSCDEGHVACFSCMETLIKVAVGEQKAALCGDGSSGSQCGANYSNRCIERAIGDRSLREAYDNVIAELSLRKADMEDLYTCPFCNNGVVFELPIGEQPFFDCYNCKKTSCRSCRKGMHEGPCNPEEHSKDEQETLNYVLTCCGQSFVRADGCNKVTCPRCASKWCWICKKEVPRKEPYVHFADKSYGGRGICKLFGDPPGAEAPRQPRAPRQPPREPPREQRAEPVQVICNGLKRDNQPCVYRARIGNFCRIHAGQAHQAIEIL